MRSSIKELSRGGSNNFFDLWLGGKIKKNIFSFWRGVNDGVGEKKIEGGSKRNHVGDVINFFKGYKSFWEGVQYQYHCILSGQPCIRLVKKKRKRLKNIKKRYSKKSNIVITRQHFLYAF